LRNKIIVKEESCHKLEAKVFDLRKKVDNSNKFLNSSQILNEILESQRSPNDKSGLGYKKKSTHTEESTSNVVTLKRDKHVIQLDRTQVKVMG
jgi:hypothetical protein